MKKIVTLLLILSVIFGAAIPVYANVEEYEQIIEKIRELTDKALLERDIYGEATDETIASLAELLDLLVEYDASRGYCYDEDDDYDYDYDVDVVVQ
jgi:hypothetical protein